MVTKCVRGRSSRLSFKESHDGEEHEDRPQRWKRPIHNGQGRHEQAWNARRGDDQEVEEAEVARRGGCRFFSAGAAGFGSPPFFSPLAGFGVASMRRSTASRRSSSPLGLFVMSDPTEPKPIDIGEVLRHPGQHDLMLHRGHAVQAYAALEQSLCELLARLLRTERDVAAVVFYRMVNTRSRNSILEKLLRKREESKYNIFFNSLISHIKALDAERNGIVHWHLVTEIGGTGDAPSIAHSLRPPTFWDSEGDETPQHTLQSLASFIDKGHFLSRLVTMFSLHLEMEPLGDAWPDIFQ